VIKESSGTQVVFVVCFSMLAVNLQFWFPSFFNYSTQIINDQF